MLQCQVLHSSQSVVEVEMLRPYSECIVHSSQSVIACNIQKCSTCRSMQML